MKKNIIADSSGIISLINKTDNNHARAVEISRGFANAKGTIIVPSEVFSESLNIAGKKLGHSIALIIADKIQTAGTFVIFDTNKEIRKRALEIFRGQPESVSFTDCIVMASADALKTKEIFGFDDVFRKSGYQRLGLDS